MSNKKELRKFGLIFGSVFTVLGIVRMFRAHEHFLYFLSLGIIVFVLGIIAPAALKPLHFVLKKILDIIKAVVTFLVLVFVFYLVLTPISLISRLLGKKFLDIKIDKKRDSYWVPKEERKEGVERYEKQY